MAYLRYPFAATGDRTAVPFTTADGSVGYEKGYSDKYSLPRLTNPAARNVERLKMNQILFDITTAIKQYQEFGFPDFITSAENGGSPHSYSIGATVRYDDGIDGVAIYQSLIDSNTSLPTVTASWARAGVADINAIAAACAASEAQAGVYATESGDHAADSLAHATDSATSAAASALSESSSAVSAVESASSALDSIQASEAVAQPWSFSTTTTMADPSSGRIRFNNATIASVTAIAISATSYGVAAKNMRAWVNTWDDSTNTTKGILTLQSLDNPSNFAMFGVTGSVTDNTTWLQLTASFISSNGTFVSGERFATSFSATGNAGAGGGSPITSSSAQAFAVGQNGNTNPAFNVDASTASSANGLNVKSSAAGNGVVVSVISSAAAESLTIQGKGFSALNLDNSGGFVNIQSQKFSMDGSGYATFAYGNRAFVSTIPYRWTGGTDSSLPASAETTSSHFNFAQTKTHSTGAITLQRDMRYSPSTHAFVAASTITDAYGCFIDNAPIAGTNATITNTCSLGVGGGAVNGGGTATNSFGLYVKPNTGATTNWGSFQEGKQGYEATNTAGGTTGAQTINKPSGTVNFAAAANSLVVTNSLCTTNSIVFAVVRTNDTTALIKNVTPAAGSFTIRLNANATAETSVGFWIIN